MNKTHYNSRKNIAFSKIHQNFIILICDELAIKVATITENKVTEIFCMADEFLKFFDKRIVKETLRPVLQ